AAAVGSIATRRRFDRAPAAMPGPVFSGLGIPCAVDRCDHGAGAMAVVARAPVPVSPTRSVRRPGSFLLPLAGEGGGSMSSWSIPALSFSRSREKVPEGRMRAWGEAWHLYRRPLGPRESGRQARSNDLAVGTPRNTRAGTAAMP